MTTMKIDLPEDMKAFVEAQAAEEGYPSVGEYLQAMIRDARRRSKAKRDLVAKLDEALASGPAEPMTRADWADLERKVWERDRDDQASQS